MAKIQLPPNFTKTARTVFSIGFLFLAAWYIYVHQSEFKVLIEVSYKNIVMLAAAILVHSLLSAARFAGIYKAIGANMGVWESFGLSTVASALNTVLPAQAGAVARAVYLKQRYNIPYSQAPAIFLGSFVFFLFIGSLLMLFSNVVVLLMGQPAPLVLWLGALAAGASVVLFWIAIPEIITSRLGRIGNMLRLFSDGWRKLRSNKRRLFEIGLYQFLMFAGAGIVITVAYSSLGVKINPLIGISIAVFTSLSNTIVITPGNLGVQEAVIGYLSQLSGLSFVQGVAVSALIRAVGLVVTLGIAPVAWYLLFFRNNINIRQNSETQTGKGSSSDAPPN